MTVVPAGISTPPTVVALIGLSRKSPFTGPSMRRTLLDEVRDAAAVLSEQLLQLGVLTDQSGTPRRGGGPSSPGRPRTRWPPPERRRSPLAWTPSGKVAVASPVSTSLRGSRGGPRRRPSSARRGTRGVSGRGIADPVLPRPWVSGRWPPWSSWRNHSWSDSGTPEEIGDHVQREGAGVLPDELALALGRRTRRSGGRRAAT